MPINNLQTSTEKNWWTDILLLTLFLSIAFLFMLGSRPLNVPDEGRYCEIAREMLMTHNFITPHINGIIYFEKPALFYWMQAFALKFLGLNEWSCRFVDALMAVLGCLGTYFTARKLFDRRTGLFSALVLASSLLYFALARVVTLDMTVSIWLCFSLFSFILGVYVSRKYFYFVYIFAALAVLTKGLIGIIFPGSIIFLWMLFTRNWEVLKSCYLLRGLLIFLLISLPWHILVQIKNPEFFHFYFIDQQFTRYLTLASHRYGAVWYYIPILILGFFPWMGFIYGTLKRIAWKDLKETFFFIAFLFIFIFFSFSKSKLVPYILPCFPLFSILMGKYFSEKNLKNLWPGFITFSVISLAIVIAIPFFLSPAISTDFPKLQFWTNIASVILFLSAILIPWIYYKKGFMYAFVILLLSNLLFLFTVCATVPYIYMDSIKSLALPLKSHLKSSDIVVTYDYYYQDLPFYLQRDVTIVNWKGELEFGQGYPHLPMRKIDDTAFWPLWLSSQRVYMLVPTDLFVHLTKRFPHYHFYLKSESKNDVLLTNHEDK